MTNQTNEHIKINIMEELVNEEIANQVKDIPEDINCVEVATYVLNRLPALYASCHKGANKQRIKGRGEYRSKIAKFVRCGIVLVRQDVFRNASPLQAPESLDPEQLAQLKESLHALTELSKFLPNQNVSWDEIIETVRSLKDNSFIFDVNDFEDIEGTEIINVEDSQGNNFVFDVDESNGVEVAKSNIEYAAH